MKRLIKKSEQKYDVEIGDSVKLDDDKRYNNLEIDDLSIPIFRDGAVLIDTKEKVIRWGLNGTPHEYLLDKYYSDLVSDFNNGNYEIDHYVTPGVYLKNFLGHETIILYNDDDSGVEDVILKEKPNARIYVDTQDGTIQRIAKNDHLKRLVTSNINDRLGKCYQLSWQYVTNNFSSNNIFLVHGTLNNTSGRGKYKQITHAWIEENGEVYDPVSDLRFTQNAHNLMYRPENVKKYTPMEAIKLSMKFGHYGPWE